MTLRQAQDRLYHLENKLSAWLSHIVVVGCGGTGGFVAEGLCRLLPPQATLVLVDHDRVEERNLVRQSFYREDMGRFKAQALAERLARRSGRPVAYALDALIPGDWRHKGPMDQAALVIGCVDNPLAREAIVSHVRPDRWWVDAGNGRDFGQILVGNARPGDLRGAFDSEKGLCHALPLPTLVCPELLVPANTANTTNSTNCAQAVAVGEQNPTINQAMAALVLEVVRQLLEDDCTWWQVYLDLAAGTLMTVEASPEAVARLTGVSVRRLVDRVSNYEPQRL